MLKIFLFLDILEIVKKKPIALRNQTQLNPLRTNPSMDHHLRDVPLSNPLSLRSSNPLFSSLADKKKSKSIELDRGGKALSRRLNGGFSTVSISLINRR